MEFPRGHARNPMTDQEVEAKFHSMAAPHVGPAERGNLLQCIWNLEQLTSVTDLLSALTTPV